MHPKEENVMRIIRNTLVTALVAVGGAIGYAIPAVAQTTLNVVTAGDQNMVDYVNNFLGPRFEKQNPGVKVRAVGTGPGDAGSQKIYEKLSAQQKAGSSAWDTDVAVVHQRGAATMVKENLLAPYRNEVAAGKLVSRDSAKNALGQNVDGYVIPMFHSQIAFAYNPDVVKQPPKSYAELAEWVKKNPKQFGYNGVKGGMSGVGFVMGWVNAYAGMGDQLVKGPYDPSKKAVIDRSLASLKDFNQYVVPAGPADVLRRAGEGGERRAREEVHRLRGEPRDPGRGHRQAVQLVPGDRRAVRQGEDGREELEQALHRHHARSARELRQAVPAVGVLHRHPRKLRTGSVEVTA
jgi:ABC-type uncharacterized transport system YnjBCD substrate-binding protein